MTFCNVEHVLRFSRLSTVTCLIQITTNKISVKQKFRADEGERREEKCLLFPFFFGTGHISANIL